MNVRCKDELSHKFDNFVAEFYGFLIASGRIVYLGKEKGLSFSLSHINIVRKIIKIMDQLKIERKKDILQSENNRRILISIGINREYSFEKIKNYVSTLNTNEIYALLRGIFLGCGILSSPPSYHLELRLADSKAALFTFRLLRKIDIKSLKRENIIYIKGRSNIETFLYGIGAMNTFLFMEEDAVNKNLINSANRKANCEYANIKRQSDASTRQITILKKMKEEGLLDNLPYKYKEVVELRLNHPLLSFGELSRKTNGKLSKQTIYYRLRRIIDYYKGTERNGEK